MPEDLTPRDNALIALLWDYMKPDTDPQYKKTRVQTSYGTKTKQGLAASITRIFRDHQADGQPQQTAPPAR